MDSWKLVCVLTSLLYLVISSSAQHRGDVSESNVKYVEEAGQILNTIFHNYREIIPPRKHYPHPVLLGISLHVLYVSDFDIVAQTLTSTVELEVTWTDSRLSWNPVAVHEITIPKEKVWTPELSMNNAIGDPQVIDDQKYIIKNTGELYMYTKMQLTTTCVTNHTSNEAYCDILVGSNLLNDEIIDFDMNKSSCDIMEGMSNHRIEAKLQGYDKSFTERAFLKENATFPEMSCQLSLKLTDCCDEKPEKTSTASSKMSNGAPSTVCTLSGFLIALLVSLTSSVF